jgi:hypothetical protein
MTQALLILAAHRASNVARIRDNTVCDKAYTSEYNRYCSWVAKQPELHTSMAPFITRTNIDHYFTRVISRRLGVRNTVRRCVSALQWYASHREHIGVDPAFVVDSPDVEEAMRAQKIHMMSFGSEASGGSDPHKGLKDILPLSEKLLIMRYIYRSRKNDWGAASVNFAWGQNGAVRGASNRKLKLSDLNISFGFGPEDYGRQARALLLVLRKGNIHKDRHETDDQVCAWRHKHYELCSVFSTAMYVISSVSQNPSLSFLHSNKSRRAPWWEIPLIDWDEYSGT